MRLHQLSASLSTVAQYPTNAEWLVSAPFAFADILVPANSRPLSGPEDGQEPELVQVVVKPGEWCWDACWSFEWVPTTLEGRPVM